METGQGANPKTAYLSAVDFMSAKDGFAEDFRIRGGCRSIVYAAERMEKKDPMAIMGLFDISRRRAEGGAVLSPIPIKGKRNLLSCCVFATKLLYY